ncbi:class F sortase [Actinomadura rudentiformis]|uniref:Class F sortase n=1 Tax=Actinomadura rudentiformis TaxID=359158 RepID=A0A6H9ZAC9_9ACTN|nr:class F sortase [Actinomadura rudentiformis]KAB2352645.1 class F sortase [Actinomadura rudentiformis]
MGESNGGYLIAVGLAVFGAMAVGQGVKEPREQPDYRDQGGPRAIWNIPDGPELPASPPERLEIPEIGVDAPVMRLDKKDDGTVEVPPFEHSGHAGWYQRGPAPGSRGSAVVLGHYDDLDGAAVFYELHRLRPGARIRVLRRDGTKALFRVDAVEQIRKWDFPRDRVYGDVRYAGLRLVTCGGSYDKHERSYRDNVIVYAHLAGGR